MPVLLPTVVLRRYANPFRNSPWGVRVTRKEVGSALRKNRLEPMPDTSRHIERIAYLVLNPAEDPIEVDVGVPELGYHSHWFIQDGNHRFAAALFRGDSFISACVSGSLNYARELFGIDCEDPNIISEAQYHPG